MFFLPLFHAILVTCIQHFLFSLFLTMYHRTPLYHSYSLAFWGITQLSIFPCSPPSLSFSPFHHFFLHTSLFINSFSSPISSSLHYIILSLWHFSLSLLSSKCVSSFFLGFPGSQPLCWSARFGSFLFSWHLVMTPKPCNNWLLKTRALLKTMLKAQGPCHLQFHTIS